MLSLLVSAIFLGLIFNAAPGPLFAETVRQAARGGFRPALKVQIGSTIGDALWAVLGLVGVGTLLQIDVLKIPIGLVGAAYLLWLAHNAWREANREFQIRSDTHVVEQEAFRSGVMLSVTNPQNIAYWAALGSAMAAVGISEPTIQDYAVFFVGFMLSSLIWSYVCAGLVAQLFLRSTGRWTRLTYQACAIGFVILAAISLNRLWQAHSTGRALPSTQHQQGR
jgi:chemosensory pili system protein ChpE/L-lysine exporter family protein LysE/ArgO